MNTATSPNFSTSVRVFTWRNLMRYRRIPALAVFTLVIPIMFVALFRIVFAGAIRIPGNTYIDFLLPGILVQTIMFGSTQTGVAFAEDRATGALDQFRALPVRSAALFAGRMLSDTLRNVVALAAMVVVGVAVGFRFHASVASILAGLGVVIIAGAAFSWVAALLGLALKHVESAHDAGFVWLIPLTFGSSLFVPVGTMPGWFQPVARANPMTAFVDATRALLIGGGLTHPLLLSFGWAALLLAVFVPATTRHYRALA